MLVIFPQTRTTKYRGILWLTWEWRLEKSQIANFSIKRRSCRERKSPESFTTIFLETLLCVWKISLDRRKNSFSFRTQNSVHLRTYTQSKYNPKTHLLMVDESEMSLKIVKSVKKTARQPLRNWHQYGNRKLTYSGSAHIDLLSACYLWLHFFVARSFSPFISIL